MKFLEAFSGRLDRLSPQQQAQFLMALGQHIGVRAELGEVILYQGKPYVTIDGRSRQAHATGLLTGLTVRPATSMERRNYGAAEGVALWVAEAHRRGGTRPFQGWGEAGGPSDKNPISKDAPAKNGEEAGAVRRAARRLPRSARTSRPCTGNTSKRLRSKPRRPASKRTR